MYQSTKELRTEIQNLLQKQTDDKVLQKVLVLLQHKSKFADLAEAFHDVKQHENGKKKLKSVRGLLNEF